MLRTGGTWGAVEDTQYSAWTRAHTENSFTAACWWSSLGSEGTALISVPRSGTPQSPGIQTLPVSYWYNSVGCNKISVSISMRRQSIVVIHKQNCLHSAASPPELS